MIGFLILSGVMIALLVILLGATDVDEIKKNWPKYRCNPAVMPLASFFGHDTGENFQFCLGNIINLELGGVLQPIFKLMATFLQTLSTLVGVANNIRLEIATMMGGINTLFQNFIDRFVQLSDNIKVTSQRIKMLMGRLYATFYALIFMGLSATTAMLNFGDTFIFKFLDTFCFDPDTKVKVCGKGEIPVKNVKIDDIFENGSKVTATFAFEADGQPMVKLPGDILVSTNHYVAYKNKWVRADEHPDAILVNPWSGGKERPLICFNTHDHRIPVGNYVFLDYDETSAADQETMNWVESRVNGFSQEKERSYEYSTLMSPCSTLVLKSGERRLACSIELGTELSMGKVVSVIRKKAKYYCTLPTGDFVTPGCMVWDSTKKMWYRAGDRYPQFVDNLGRDYYSFIVSPSANIELASGAVLRDYFEVHSPETEQFYEKAIEQASYVLAE